MSYSGEWIRKILHKLGHTYKRGARKPTKASNEVQVAFKKISDLMEDLAGRDNACLVALDETGIRLEGQLL